MSDDDHNRHTRPDPHVPVPFKAPRRRWRRDRTGRTAKPKVKKLRLLSILVGLGALAIVSTVFGMMMAVASDLPQLENRQQYKEEKNSYLYDDMWRPIGIFAPPNHVVIDTYGQLGTTMQDAIIAVEDKRFWSDPGVDIRGIARALVADATGGATQGASTIAQQFVKNALSQEGNRTVLEKLREAALAYHLTHRWKKTKILTEYLNSIYFGNGAYGVESAARVYFGDKLGYNADSGTDQSTTGCGDSTTLVHRQSCASVLSPPQAALLAGMVANPSAFDPIAHPEAATARRNLVLRDMLNQNDISELQYKTAIAAKLPHAADIEQPQEPPAAPYFTSWLRPQILSALGSGHGVSPQVAEYRAYYGGLKIRTTIDLPMQQAAEHAVSAELPSGSGYPAASLVAIDNKTGQVRAMVGGPLVDGVQDYPKYPFNLATEGHRQPGSAFKPFTLAVGLEHGYGPDSVFDSHPFTLTVPNSDGKEHYQVKNFGNAYSGSISLAAATDYSDNTVFTQLGLSPGVGTKRIAKMAGAMGIRSPVSTNYAMIIGGLKEGVTPLDMAHAYETIAEGGRRVYTPNLGAPSEGPTGIAQIQCMVIKCHGKKNLVAVPHYDRVIPASVAHGIHTLLQGVVQHGTGQSAAISGVDVAGKTGTTSDYGDAWFVGWTPEITTAVWVGFPNKLIPMTTLFNGQPVEGGTYPAIIWQNFMSQALQIAHQEAAELAARHPHAKTSSTGTDTTGSGATGTTGGSVGSTVPSSPGTATNGAPTGGGTGTTGGGTGATGGGTGATGGGTGATGGGTGATGGGTGATGGGTGATGGGTGGTGGGTGGGSSSGASGGAGLGGG
jgi:penicillin-binding protein 1A